MVSPGSTLLLAAALLSWAAHAQERSPDLRRFAAQSQAVSLSEELLAKGEHDRALANALKLKRSAPAGLVTRIDLVIAKCRFARGEHALATEAVRAYVADRSEFRPERWEFFDIAAKVQIARGEKHVALATYDWLANAASGHHKVLAAEACGGLLEDVGCPDKAVAVYDFALRYIRSHFQGYERDEALVRRLRAARGRATDRRDAALCGEDFVLYREAERLRREAGQHQKAAAAYRRIIAEFPTGAYAQAAAMYLGYCLRDTGDWKGAAQHWARFYREMPGGLYRGEALCAMAEVYLERALDPASARKMLQQLSRWLDTSTAEQAVVDAVKVPEDARRLTAPPQQTYRVDTWGNVLDADIKPGQLVNRRTCAWYLDSLRARAALRLGFLDFIAGDMASARRRFGEISSCDMKVRFLQDRNMPNMLRRLTVRCEQGTFRRAAPEEVACFADPRRRFVVFLADFYAECEEPTRAEPLYRRLLAGEFGRLSAAEEVYSRFGLAWALWYAGVQSSDGQKKTEAKAVLEPVLEQRRLQAAPTAPRALNALANVLRYDGDGAARSLDVSRFVARNYLGSSHAETALYRLAQQCLQDGSTAELRREGLASLRLLLSRYPDGVYSDLAKDLRERGAEGG